MWRIWTAHYLMENTQSVLMVFGGVGRKDSPVEAGKGRKEAEKDRAEAGDGTGVKAGFK
jgi:hypothetical protein